MPKVLHIRNTHKDAIYIGRPKGGQNNQHYGNPFTHLVNTTAKVVLGNREEAVKAFEQWILGTGYQNIEPERRQWILDNLDKLKGKDLVCFCAPKQCHGDILIKFSNTDFVEEK